MPLSLHVVTGKKDRPSREGRPKVRLDARSVVRARLHESDSRGRSARCTDMIFSGVLDRFPALKIVSAENDSGWIAHFMYRLDHAFEKFGVMMGQAARAEAE